MTNLTDIPVTVEQHAPSQVLAVLNEIDAHLQLLTDQGSESAIDLRSLPLFPGDYELLRELLGEGEITATLDSLGPTYIYETRIPGVWWVTHYNDAEEKIAEFIEITRLPALLQTDTESLQYAPAALAVLIGQLKGEHDASR